jgi:hypothetical protein
MKQEKEDFLGKNPERKKTERHDNPLFVGKPKRGDGGDFL